MLEYDFDGNSTIFTNTLSSEEEFWEFRLFEWTHRDTFDLDSKFEFEDDKLGMHQHCFQIIACIELVFTSIHLRYLRGGCRVCPFKLIQVFHIKF